MRRNTCVVCMECLKSVCLLVLCCLFSLVTQVRSKEMHQKAEFGLAAHWSYKGSRSVVSALGWTTGGNVTDTSTPSADKVAR